jgi:hypothetical protein
MGSAAYFKINAWLAFFRAGSRQEHREMHPLIIRLSQAIAILSCFPGGALA